MLASCVLLSALASPPIPPLDAVRAALRRNAEGLRNRRLKYVVVYSSGPPRAEFPPLHSPDRDEVEVAAAADGRWRRAVAEVRAGVVTGREERAFDGSRVTWLVGRPGPS